MAQILDGKRVRDEILAELPPRIAALRRPPGLAVVLVGGDAASELYVNTKVKTCASLGLASEKITRPNTISTAELLAIIDELNGNDAIDGILIQLPLPNHIDGRQVLERIAPEKDVDGFHPVNVGRLSLGLPCPRPCTPNGVMQLLHRTGITVAGKRAVVVGRSDIVGKPMAMLLLHANATVTICHSRTEDLAAECQRADILVGAVGRPAFLTAEHIRPGAVVIDVGINRLTERSAVESIWRNEAKALAEFDRNGRILVGDVHPLDVAALAGAWTPVPGGVGPLTIAMLMSNTVEAAERRQGC